MLQTGYILGRNADLIWFLGLPYLALAAALACQQWLSAVAVASVTLWITIPHHFATWVRAYGIAEDRMRWKARLILGPIVIFAMALLGLVWAPITVLLLAILWDKQHVLMQQHGFARIYDFKARAGAPATSRFDLALNWALFLNLFLTSPLFTPIWLLELYRLQLPLSAGAIRNLHWASWTATGLVLAAYLGHVLWSLRRGYRLNPVKYLFIGSSYFMWYYLAWHTASALVFTIASGLLHGIQYIVISYWYTRQRTARSGNLTGWAARLVRPGNLAAFLMLCLFYAFVYQVLVGKPLEIFGFGYWHLQGKYNTPVRNMAGMMNGNVAYDLFAAAIVEVASLTHFYFDSFIWKVSDAKTREGL
jgi:hypothetical protein